MSDSFKDTLCALHNRPETEWQRRGDAFMLKLFRDTAKNVPAYKAFLRSHGVTPGSIRDIATFKKEIPLVSKENYLKVYPLNELLPAGDIAGAQMISTSSGSSGIPFYWPRSTHNIDEAALIHELFLVDIFHINKKRTLLVNTFAMGMWVAGTTTFESVSRIADKYRITMVTPGIDMEQILTTINALGKYYEQIIIAGYPPFVKDIIDIGKERGIKWQKLNVRFLFAAESFSEDWREHMHKLVGCKDPLSGSINIYGTADALLVAHETPLSILIRKLATKSGRLHKKLFGPDLRIPTLAQWNPSMRYFEELPDAKIIFSANSGIPLIRYDIGDTGNILHIKETADLLRSEGVDLKHEAKVHNISRTLWNLPILTIYGRDRMTASLYGLKIYPEHVRGALEGKTGSKYATGRFVMTTKLDADRNQYLEIHIELHSKIQSNKKIIEHLQMIMLKQLRAVNSEFKRLHESLGERAVPKIVLHQNQTSSLFSRKGKQVWKG
ncbi:MAG: hypothetical protein A2845_02375 [Candidatus Lloydbacteria bacterium RIFCSPHIGHO2_01_FULL_49_22]|uniref:Phenylacetate--CoA ligase n=1 Tax=Candidatus Lloydbacteria bacterium RIFCSPHIGHO2_01_FULL_49_22 TaxID=1798658 RepID=A0A1G2CV87_9BACT|nr:MAG: hypothetical protein A2845_02375 [Candidatus Lloydbacteria bacterium RIFCSPHIGHO2_01_FULL_49_22]OGZ10294.1 MAG: hypothetical protein A3C14_02075 [Candidatus Lloydbacteria bacterium RIFCSPHIGHO2_02_FULL_50_18]